MTRKAVVDVWYQKGGSLGVTDLGEDVDEQLEDGNLPQVLEIGLVQRRRIRLHRCTIAPVLRSALMSVWPRLVVELSFVCVCGAAPLKAVA